MLKFDLEKCNNATSTVVCAWFGHNDDLFYRYLKDLTLELSALIKYVDHSEVEPFLGPVKSSHQSIEF